MRKLLDPGYWRAVSRNPAAVAGLAADLFPVIAVIFWGWGAGALIVLYWLENVVIGLFTIPRMMMAAIGKHGLIGVLGSAVGVPFFVVHYGGFCVVHGFFVLSLMGRAGWESVDWAPGDVFGWLFGNAATYAQHMDWMVVLLLVAHGFAFAWEFVLKGGWKDSDAEKEMGAPYGRVIILHLSIFVLGGLMFLLGDPMIGAVFIVLCRALWGLHTNMQPRRKPEAMPAPLAA